MIENSEYSRFLEQIKEIHRLEKLSSELYKFCLDACKEIHKYTGQYDWNIKLESTVKNTRHRSD